ncbi:MAG: SLBB domain-containing protein [Candidatus Brocadiia bacterium]
MKRSVLIALVIVFLVGHFAYGEGYRIRPGDELSISVKEAPEFDGVYLVSDDGTVDFPEIGTIPAGGKTAAEAATAIREGLQKQYLSRATVRVSVSKYTPVRYFVLGMVRNPGAFEIPPGSSVSLLQALAFAGGVLETADTSAINIIRTSKGTISVDLRPAFDKGNAICDQPVMENDIIIVLKKKELFAFVFGAVTSPGRIDFPDDVMTVNLGVLIALAGGLKEVSDGEVQIYPKDANGTVTPTTISFDEKGLKKSDLAMSISPGELVFVCDRKTKVYVLGKVKNPGAIPYRSGITISEAVALAGGLAQGSAENRAKLITTNADGTRLVREVNLSKILAPAENEAFHDIVLDPGTIIVIPESRL